MATEISPGSAATQAMRQAIVGSGGTPVVFDYVRARDPEGIKFDVWYCNTHLPAVVDEYSVRRLRRYAVPAQASFLAVGELDSGQRNEGVGSCLVSLPAMVGRHEQFIGEPLGTQRRRDASESIVEAAVVYPALLRVPHDRMLEVGRWYEEEHLPMLMACPQWVMTRRFQVRAARGFDFTHVALHYLTDLRALQSPQRDAARCTPWRDKLKAEGWFTPEYRVGYRMQDF